MGGNIEPALRKEDAYFKLIADDGGNNMFTSGGDLFVHPGMSLQVFSFEFDVVRQSDAGFLRKHRAHDTSVYFEYAYGCQDARMKRGKWQLVGAELEDFIEPTARRSDRLRHQPEDHPVADWQAFQMTPSPPKWIKPQLTRLVDEAPAGAGWVHEIKYDGYRMHAQEAGRRNC